MLSIAICRVRNALVIANIRQDKALEKEDAKKNPDMFGRNVQNFAYFKGPWHEINLSEFGINPVSWKN